MDLHTHAGCRLLGILLSVLLFIPTATAQVVIEERLEVTPDSSQPDSVSGHTARASSRSAQGTTGLIAETSGRLKILYLSAEQYAVPLETAAQLQVWIQGEEGSRYTQDAVEPRFPTPLSLYSGSCPEKWYYYGEGPFSYEAPSTPEAVADAHVFSLDCSSSYARSRGVCASTNFGGTPHLQATAWTWWGAAATLRSFLRFDLSALAAASENGPPPEGELPPEEEPGIALEHARLRLTPRGEGQSELSGSNAFYISQVAESWGESTIDWNNQPQVTPLSLSAPGGTGSYAVKVTPIVRNWLSHPETNHGFRLALQTEQHYRRQSFASSDYSEVSARPKLELEFRNPSGASTEILDAGAVSKGDLMSFAFEAKDRGSWLGNYEFTQLEVDGKKRFGRLITFSSLSSCPAAGDELKIFAFIKEEVLDIVIPEPKEVWPKIPAGGASRYFDFSEVDSVKKDISVRVTQDGEPLPDQVVQITADWVVGSGGHDHQNAPPTEMMGRFRVHDPKPPYPAEQNGQIFALADERGRVDFAYTAPVFGGQVVLRAKAMLGGEPLVDQDTLEVRVPNLVLLPKSSGYQQIGGTRNHNGPGSFEVNNNHYGVQAMIDSLVSLARYWSTLEASEEMEAGQVPLSINDMSLPWGGLFDISGGWKPSHDFHRVGRDVDIRTTRPSLQQRIGVHMVPLKDGSGNIVLEDDEEVYWSPDFEKAFKNKGFTGQPHCSPSIPGVCGEHYHLYFYSN